MRRSVSAAVVVGLWAFHAFSAADRAEADVVVNINKSKQRMAIVVDGVERHVWRISTGTGGGPPSGTYRPQRLERKWFSRKYNWSPMPHSIFFHEGYAIHGTVYVSRLGRRASHGCVRLHPRNAAALFDLVRSRGMRTTTIVVSNTDYVAKPELNLRSSLPAADGSAPPASGPELDAPPEHTGIVSPAPAVPIAPITPSTPSDGEG
jgi:lipoprotein-anchoring transpeptidase ErfK/SrfK